MKAYLMFVVLFLSIVQVAEAATIQINPQDITVNIGDTFTVEISGQDFPETQGGGFSLAYDAGILNVTNMSIDEVTTWTFVNNLGEIDNIRGEVHEVNVSDFPGVRAGEFTVASIEFLAIGLGTTRLELMESRGNPWASNGSVISPIELDDGLVQVVPVPAAALLLGSGLLTLLSVSVRKSSKQDS